MFCIARGQGAKTSVIRSHISMYVSGRFSKPVQETGRFALLPENSRPGLSGRVGSSENGVDDVRGRGRSWEDW